MMVAIIFINIISFNAIASNEKNISIFSENEKKQLQVYSSKLSTSPEVMCLKEQGYLDDFIIYLSEEYNNQLRLNYNESIVQLKEWGLSENMTISELKTRAQKCLNMNYNGILIGSNDFDLLVKSYLYDESNQIVKKANENSAFAALYVYMCIYNEYFLRVNTLTNNNFIDRKQLDVDSYILSDVIMNDVTLEMKNSYVPILVETFMEENNLEVKEELVLPKLNSAMIQAYALLYSASEQGNTEEYHHIDGGDCTNFVSQCLRFAKMPFYAKESDKHGNGYIQTDERWFYYKNSSATGYSVSTSWIRVSELYDYLSPHYTTVVKIADEDMTPYLYKGDILQGKPFIGSYSHSVVITKTFIEGTSVYEITYCAHTNARRKEPIQTFYDGFYKGRIIHVCD